MTYYNLTPESRLSRNDSKNPASTCKGLTTAGKPCRRSISVLASNKSISNLNIGANGRVSDVLHQAYCWQHQDQAQIITNTTSPSVRKTSTHALNLAGRCSIDSLVERLGVVNLGDTSETFIKDNQRRPRREVYRQKRPSLWSKLCCFSIAEETEDPRYDLIRYNRPRQVQMSQTRWSVVDQQSSSRPTSITPLIITPSSANGSPIRKINYSSPVSLTVSPMGMAKSARKSIAGYSMSYLSHLSAEKAGILSAELAKPLSLTNAAGYIYVFRLSPTLEPSRSSKPSSSLLLKIGRASNVHRRMNQWSQQCGYSPQLLRWYPYISSSSSPNMSNIIAQPYELSPSNDGRLLIEGTEVKKVPHVQRVERLVHLELADRRRKQSCLVCGKEHREWFEIDNTMEGIKAVDEVIKRWVSWAENNTS